MAEAVARGIDLETLKLCPCDAARRELMGLPGVGPYTADLTLIHAARSCAALFLDVYIREVLRQLYFGGARVPDEALRAFAQARWGPAPGIGRALPHDHYRRVGQKAWGHLRLRSAALSDPDPG